MSWPGYFEVLDQQGAPIEIINGSRTEAYVSQAQRYWLHQNYNDNPALPWLLGAYPLERWRTPLLDDAPWTDPDVPESFDFWGIYPLGVSGLEDSTREGTAYESILDGGIPGRLRHSTRTLVFQCLILAADDHAAEYGIEWLKKVLLGSGCIPKDSSCFGGTLRYLSGEPDADMNQTTSVGTPAECINPLVRELYRFSVTRGPLVTDKRTSSDGSAIWSIQFTGVAGNPFAYTLPKGIVRNFGSVADPYEDGIEGGVVDNTGGFYVDEVCPVDIYEPVYNPACPAPVAPPAPPTVETLCGPEFPDFWVRRSFTIPGPYVPLWTNVVPQIFVTPPDGEDLGVFRLRFFDDIDETGVVDNCAPLGDIVISYLQDGWTLVIDAVREQIYVRDGGGGQRRADALVFDSESNPIDWFTISCGHQILVTADSVYLAERPNVTLNLVGKGN